MVNWQQHKATREAVMRVHGQYVGLYDKNWEPVLDIEDWVDAEWGGTFADVGNMSMTLPGEISPGVVNPVVDYLLRDDLRRLDEGGRLDALIHGAVHVVVERPGLRRRCYRILETNPRGGDPQGNPAEVELSGVDSMEHLKHLPLWADPANRSKVVQLQWEDRQDGSAEKVSRKLIGRNLIGYQQPSLLDNMFSWTDSYTSPSQWRGFNPSMHPVICSPVMSGTRSEWCIVSARWDNAWDLLKATWAAAGVQPFAWLWLPGDPQPFPSYTTLSLPTTIIDFAPRATVTGAAGIVGQAFRQLKRTISSDDFITSTTEFADVDVRNADGRKPWVVYTLMCAPSVKIRKSTDHRFLVGGKSPDIVNKAANIGVKTLVAAMVAGIPGIGPVIAEAIKGGGELLAELSADRLFVLNEYVDKNRQFHYGRSRFTAISKPGEANTVDSLQKAWQAKQETEGGISAEFSIDSPDPYLPGRDFDLGDTIGVTAWGVVWAAYVSGLTWTSKPGQEVGWTLRIGDYASLASPGELYQANKENIRAVIGRLAVTKGG
ncbi:hypothetical protein [Corynebacterium sp. HMSC036D02]|uniref:Gp37-like protein n=1 Tax=Corynebacterium sp. HMSC036D02 TaxID=1715013 RepID=UPI0008AA3ECF|nr:hypothetical protein [Corynebacterium sp. HMSC036D02]OHO60893.1 hypothetical protein HMPREF2743_04775 [Corynebacterium sp. HMSC036D02]